MRALVHCYFKIYRNAKYSLNFLSLLHSVAVKFVFIVRVVSFFPFDTGDCDHLEKCPVYSEMQRNFTFTSWNKPWPSEIDWMNSYVNLSSVPLNILEGLLLGFRVTKHPKYFYQSHTRCWLRFKYDIELTQSHYLEHYANTSSPMLLCTPNVPMRPDTFRDWTENHNALLGCFNYYLGVLEVKYGESNWNYIWTHETLGLSLAFAAAVLIFLSGIIGEYRWSILLILEDICHFYWATDIPIFDLW